MGWHWKIVVRRVPIPQQRTRTMRKYTDLVNVLLILKIRRYKHRIDALMAVTIDA